VNLKKRINVDLSEISVIEMPVRPTLDIMSTRQNINGAGLLTPLEVGTTLTLVTKVTMGTKWLDGLYIGGVSVVGLL
jgi:hypothetical protein